MSKLVAGGTAWCAPSTIQDYLVEDGLLHHRHLGRSVRRALPSLSAHPLRAASVRAWCGLKWIDFAGDSARAAAITPGIGADALRDAMHVVTPTGQVVAGYDAFREIARALPLLAPTRLVLALPWAGFVGPCVCARIVATRPRDVPCRAGVCEVPGLVSR